MGEQGATLERFVTWAALRLDDVRPREVRRVAVEIEEICAGGPPTDRDIATLVKMRRDSLAGGHAILTAERVAREYQTWHKEGKPRAVASLRPPPREEPGSELHLEERGILSAASELIRSSSPPPSPPSRPSSSSPPSGRHPSNPPSSRSPGSMQPSSRTPSSSPPPSSSTPSARPASWSAPPTSRSLSSPPSADGFESSDLLQSEPPPASSSSDRERLFFESEPPPRAAPPLRAPPPPPRRPKAPTSDRPPNSAARSGRSEPPSRDDDAYALAVDPPPSTASGRVSGKDFDRDLASGKESIVAPSSIPPPLMGRPPSLPPVRSIPAPVMSEPVGPELFGVRLPTPPTMIRIALGLVGIAFLAVFFLKPQWLTFGKGARVSGTVTNDHLELALDFPNDWYYARAHDDKEVRNDFERRISVYFQGNDVGDATSEVTVIEYVPTEPTRQASADDLRALGAPEVVDAGMMRDCRQEIDQRGDPVHRCTSVTERLPHRYAQLETYFLEHGRVVFVRGLVDLPRGNAEPTFKEVDQRLETVDQIVASIRFAK